MCACEPGFICRQCAGTPFDPYYMEDDPPRLTESEFEDLSAEPFSGRWEGWA